MSKPELEKSCLILENRLAPWLMPPQIRHVRAFASTQPALRMRLSRLLARILAFRQNNWRQRLDRDAQGRAFFSASSSPVAFSHTPEAAFCATCADFHTHDSLAIDVENPSLGYNAHVLEFLRKIFPVPLKDRKPDPGLLTRLWILWECLYKCMGERILRLDLPATILQNLQNFPEMRVYLPDANLHFQIITSRDFLIGIVSQEIQDCDCVWTDPRALLSSVDNP